VKIRERALVSEKVDRRSGAKAQEAAEVVNNLRRLFKAIQEHSKAILRKTGLSGPQVWALTILDAEPELSLGELAERLFAHPSTVSGIVDRLEKRGAIRRAVDPLDGRGIRLSLTPPGRRLLKRSPPPFQVGLRAALEELPASQLRQLRRGLERVVTETSARGMAPTFFDVEALMPRRFGRAQRRWES
jgi:MarR family transcriptional regulator, organic hydroperoxide resistance regulator